MREIDQSGEDKSSCCPSTQPLPSITPTYSLLQTQLCQRRRPQLATIRHMSTLHPSTAAYRQHPHHLGGSQSHLTLARRTSNRLQQQIPMPSYEFKESPYTHMTRNNMRSTASQSPSFRFKASIQLLAISILIYTSDTILRGGDFVNRHTQGKVQTEFECYIAREPSEHLNYLTEWFASRNTTIQKVVESQTKFNEHFMTIASKLTFEEKKTTKLLSRHSEVRRPLR